MLSSHSETLLRIPGSFRRKGSGRELQKPGFCTISAPTLLALLDKFWTNPPSFLGLSLPLWKMRGQAEAATVWVAYRSPLYCHTQGTHQTSQHTCICSTLRQTTATYRLESADEMHLPSQSQTSSKVSSDFQNLQLCYWGSKVKIILAPLQLDRCPYTSIFLLQDGHDVTCGQLYCFLPSWDEQCSKPMPDLCYTDWICSQYVLPGPFPLLF